MSEFHPTYLLNACLYALAGVLLFVFVFAVLSKLTPYTSQNLWRAIVDERNVALAIVVGAVSLGVCIIIASAVH